MKFRWLGKTQDGSEIILKSLGKCEFQLPSYSNDQWIEENRATLKKGIVVDVETTGLDHRLDHVIEIGLREFLYNPILGEIVCLQDFYNEFEDPGVSIPEMIQNLTGITNEMVAGKKIDWDSVSQRFSTADLIIAHQAQFDRPFLDRRLKPTGDKNWSCSLTQIDWEKRRFPSFKLELLSAFHGFFVDAHRAQQDCDALLFLLNQTCELTGQTYFHELITNANREMVKIMAFKAPFEQKDRLKTRKYGWDSEKRVWSKVMYEENLQSELSWLEENVYFGMFLGNIHKIPTSNRFQAVE